MLYEHITEFAGKPVVTWEPGTPLTNPSETAYRLAIGWDEYEDEVQWVDKFAQFLAEPGHDQVTAFIVGAWDGVGDMSQSSDSIVEALVAARVHLPKLTHLFLGEIISEESEISWIEQSDVSSIFEAYPALEHFQVRGGNKLALEPVVHAQLKTWIVEAGALDAAIVESICASDLPNLEHLELWLGTARYGGNITLETVLPLLEDSLFPKLTYLGLRDSEILDEIAAALVESPIVDQLSVLDLSLGTLTDVGGAALLDNPRLRHLTLLDLHHHFLSTELVQKLQQSGLNVNLEGQEIADEYAGEVYRYVAVGE